MAAAQTRHALWWGTLACGLVLAGADIATAQSPGPWQGDPCGYFRNRRVSGRCNATGNWQVNLGGRFAVYFRDGSKGWATAQQAVNRSAITGGAPAADTPSALPPPPDEPPPISAQELTEAAALASTAATDAAPATEAAAMPSEIDADDAASEAPDPDVDGEGPK